MTELKVKVQKGLLRRAAALAMSVCLGMTLLPTAALAEEAAKVESIEITANKTTLTSAGEKATLTAAVTYETVNEDLDNVGEDDEETSGDTSGNQPGDTSGNQPGDTSGNQPGDTSGNQPGDTSGNQPGGNQPGDTSGNQPGGNQPGDTSGNQPGDTSGNQPGGNQPGDTSGNQPGDTSGNQPSDTAPNQPVEAKVTWRIKSGNEFVTLDADNGTTVTVTAKSTTYGQAVIVAEAGGKTAEITITVNIANQGGDDGNKTVAVSNITVAPTAVKFDTIGAKQTLTATVTPSNATNKTVTWSTSNAKVATVAGGVVTAVGNGTATITATAGGKSATATVTVSQKTTKVSITLNDQAVKGTLKSNFSKTYTLKAVVTPTNADAKNAKVTWSTSNKKIATVNAKGKVSIKKKAGTVTIKATTADGKSASVKFKVSKGAVKVSKVKLTGVKAMKTTGKLKTQTLKAVITPATADNQKLTWKSSNTKVATVNAKGKVTAKKKGKVTITATAKDGSKKKATIKITVK